MAGVRSRGPNESESYFIWSGYFGSSNTNSRPGASGGARANIARTSRTRLARARGHIYRLLDAGARGYVRPLGGVTGGGSNMPSSRLCWNRGSRYARYKFGA